MLDSKTIKKISDFVYVKPRSIQEVAHHIQKNWRTADSYIERIMKEQGILQVRTFREGTRGALKIVFWNNVENIHSSDFQERLFKKIESSKNKEDFSPFDIYQYVDEDKRYAFSEVQSEYKVTAKQNLVSALKGAEKQLLIFSGNLSWVNAVQENKKIINVFEELAEHNVTIKILCDKIKKQMIEIRHCQQPFRAFVVDDKFARFKEIRHLEKQRSKYSSYIFYEIRDEEWVEWIQKIFWNLFRTSILAEKRIKDIETIEKMK